MWLIVRRSRLGGIARRLFVDCVGLKLIIFLIVLIFLVRRWPLSLFVWWCVLIAFNCFGIAFGSVLWSPGYIDALYVAVADPLRGHSLVCVF